MSNLCRLCEYQGDYRACSQTNCSYHKLWLIQYYKQALKYAQDDLVVMTGLRDNMADQVIDLQARLKAKEESKVGRYCDEYVEDLQEEERALTEDNVRLKKEIITLQRELAQFNETVIGWAKSNQRILELEKQLEEFKKEADAPEDIAELKRMITQYQGLAVECHRLKKILTGMDNVVEL